MIRKRARKLAEAQGQQPSEVENDFTDELGDRFDEENEASEDENPEGEFAEDDPDAEMVAEEEE
jgi:hypothetical protein